MAETPRNPARKPKRIVPPVTRREMILALRAAHQCLIDAGANWPDIPSRIRLRLLRCADRLTKLLARIDNGAAP